MPAARKRTCRKGCEIVREARRSQPLRLQFIIILEPKVCACVCVCVFVKRHGGNRCRWNNIQFGSFLRSKHMFQALTRTCFPPRQPLHRELSNCLRGFKLALRRQPRDYSASTKIHICCHSGKKKKKKKKPCRITPRLASTFAHLRVPSSSTARVGRELGGEEEGVAATVAFNHVPFYWFESGSNLVSGLCKVLCCIKSRP